MLRLIYRQRRRLLFGTVFGTLALMLMALNQGGSAILGEFPGWIAGVAMGIATLVVATGIFFFSAMVILLLPNWRSMIELMAIVFFVTAVLSILAPAAFELAYVGPFIPFFLTVAIFSLLYGEALDRFRLWIDYRSTRSFISPLSPEALWAELVPGAAPIEAHWDSLLCDLDPDPDDPESLNARYTHGSSLYEHQTMTFLEQDAPYHAKYHHVGEVDPKNRSLVEGVYEVRIDPRDGGGSKVTLRASRELMLHRLALAMWFDDHLGDQTDHLMARHLGQPDWSTTGRYRQKVGRYA